MNKIISNEELCRRVCHDCGYDGGDIGLDSCVECGFRYTPNENGANEDCPWCGCDDYDTHCPTCDSTNIDYYDTFIQLQKEAED